MTIQEIPPRSGTSFTLLTGQLLKIIDPLGEQVSDLVSFNLEDKRERLSSGRSLDYASKIFLSTGDLLYSNRSRPMLRIVDDTVGRHDFLLTPCSAETFKIIYGHTTPHHGCYGNLCDALAPFGIEGDEIPTTFNVFMNVQIDVESGALTVAPPRSRAGDFFVVEAMMDMIVGLTACSAEQSNNYSFKPICYEIF